MSTKLRVAGPLERFKDIYRALERDRRWWRDSRRLRFAAMAAITSEGDPADVASGIRATGTALKEEFPWHWGVSTHVEFIVAAMLFQRRDSPKAFVRELVRVRKLFRREKLHRGLQYELIAVLILRTQAKGAAIAPATIKRFKAIYDEMKRHHRFLTGPDDFPACAILTGQPGDPRKVLEDVESIYQNMREQKFSAGNWLQSAANIMYLSDEDPRALARRARALKDQFRKRKIKTGEGNYAELAILSLLGLPASGVVARVVQIRDELREIKPRIDRGTAFNLAAGIAFLYLATPTVRSRSLGVKTLVDVQAIIAAQQAALMAAAAASAATTAAASS